jgi:RecJ-like exonuclease
MMEKCDRCNGKGKILVWKHDEPIMITCDRRCGGTGLVYTYELKICICGHYYNEHWLKYEPLPATIPCGRCNCNDYEDSLH